MTTVLVVERDPELTFFIVEVLTRGLGTTVRYAHAGPSGAKLLASETFDLAIIDVGMPVLSGLELARLAAARHVPTLLSSGNPYTLGRLEKAELRHIAKPFRLNELITAVRTTINQSDDGSADTSIEKLQSVILLAQSDMAQGLKEVAAKRAPWQRPSDRPHAHLCRIVPHSGQSRGPGSAADAR